MNPTGSIFSMLQTIIQPLQSLITSYSISLNPSRDFRVKPGEPCLNVCHPKQLLLTHWDCCHSTTGSREAGRTMTGYPTWWRSSAFHIMGNSTFNNWFTNILHHLLKQPLSSAFLWIHRSNCVLHCARKEIRFQQVRLQDLASLPTKSRSRLSGFFINYFFNSIYC